MLHNTTDVQSLNEEHESRLSENMSRRQRSAKKLEVLPKIDSERGQLLSRHDGFDSTLEFSLGVEFLELGKVDAKVVARQNCRVSEYPLVLQGLVGVQPLVRIHGKQTGNEPLRVLRYLAPVLVVELVLTLSDFAKEFSLVLFNERRVPSQ